MRCEGADNPPCRRCRNTGLECLFEKPSREATLTGEAGLEFVFPIFFFDGPEFIFLHRRIRSLENHVAEIGRTQTVISEKLSEILQCVRGGGFASARSPSAFPPYPSPSLKSPHLSASTPSTVTQHTSPPGGTPFTSIHSHSAKHRNSFSGTGYQGSSSNHTMTQDEGHSAALAPLYGNYPHGGQSYNMPHGLSSSQGPTLPPFSSIQTMAPLSQPNTLPSVRYQSGNQNFSKLPNKYATSTATKRQASSNVPSADSSDIDEDDNGELPASGLVAPWEVLRGLADVAIERATKVLLHVPCS